MSLLLINITSTNVSSKFLGNQKDTESVVKLWFEILLYRIFSTIIFWAIPRWYLGILTGVEYLPRKGPFILIANHASPFDHLLIATVIKILYDKKLYFLAKKELFEPVLHRIWCNSMGAIPLDRSNADRVAYRRVLDLLTSEEIVCIYPEGAIGAENHLLPFKVGAFRMAKRKKVPIVPVGITNSHKILLKGSFWPRRYRASLSFGQLLTYTPTLVNDDIDLKNLVEHSRTVIEHLALSDARPATQAQSIEATTKHLISLADDLIECAKQISKKRQKASLLEQSCQILAIAQHNDTANV